MDERVAQYYSLYSWLFSTIVLGTNFSLHFLFSDKITVLNILPLRTPCMLRSGTLPRPPPPTVTTATTIIATITTTPAILYLVPMIVVPISIRRQTDHPPPIQVEEEEEEDQGGHSLLLRPQW